MDPIHGDNTLNAYFTSIQVKHQLGITEEPWVCYGVFSKT